MSKRAAKRFYEAVTIAPEADGFCIKLDARTLRTPGKNPLILPSQYLATEVAKEWEAQGERIMPETMPATRLMNVAMERTPHNRDDLIAEVRKYAGTDLLCYREDQLRVLTERQTLHWDPVLEWAQRSHNITLTPTSGIVAVSQNEASLGRVAEFAAAQSDIRLTLLTHFTAVFGSAVLAIGLIDGHLLAPRALELSRLDELYQIELWGQDEEAEERTANVEIETLALARLLGEP